MFIFTRKKRIDRLVKDGPCGGRMVNTPAKINKWYLLPKNYEQLGSFFIIHVYVIAHDGGLLYLYNGRARLEDITL